MGEIITLTKAAELCGKSRYTIRDWVLRGHLKADRPGPYPDWFVDVDDLLVTAEEQLRRYHQRPIAAGPGRGYHGNPAGQLRTWEERHGAADTSTDGLGT